MVLIDIRYWTRVNSLSERAAPASRPKAGWHGGGRRPPEWARQRLSKYADVKKMYAEPKFDPQGDGAPAKKLYAEPKFDPF